jgi:hypothetical protein
MRNLRSFLLPALLAAFLAVASPWARAADGDVVHIGHSIQVPSDGSVQDAVCIFCSVHVNGKVTGDVVAIFGNVNLHGDAQHDVVSIFGSIRAARGSSVEDDVVSIFGSVHLGDGVQVGHDLVALFGALQIAPTASIGGDRVVWSVWIVLLPLLIVLLIVFVVVREYRTQKRRWTARGFPPIR